MKPLSPKQARFVEEYLVDLNATQSAIRAGYSLRTAKSQGQRLLTFVDIGAAIAKAQEKRSERLEITLDKWLRELAIIGFSDLKDYLGISADTGAIRAKAFEEMPEGASRALEAIEENRAIKENSDGESTTVYDKIKFKMHDKLGALEKIGKHLGFIKEKIEHSGPGGGPMLMIMPNIKEKSDKK